jgi:winged helix DNA-binding protein
MSAPVRASRAQVLAYRAAAQGLHRDTAAPHDLAVLDIGVQEAMGHPASLAFANRLTPGARVKPDAVAIGPGHRLVLAWTLRGAPHVHRRAELNSLAAALFPLSEDDARARLGETRSSIEQKGMSALDQLGHAVAALRDVVTAPTDKGTASTQVSARIPAQLLRPCRACGTSHVSDPTMRTAALFAGLETEPGTSPPVLLPRKGATSPSQADVAALGELAHAYLRLLGPATVGDFAGYLQARRADVAEVWPGDLVDVDVDGRPASLPSDRVDALREAPAPDVVRLLGPFDPYLQARDRDLIVPDKAAHKVLWPVLGRPGAVLADGEIVAAWRPKTVGKKLTITVDAFGAMPKGVWSQVQDEAQLVATARGAADVAVKRA